MALSLFTLAMPTQNILQKNIPQEPRQNKGKLSVSCNQQWVPHDKSYLCVSCLLPTENSCASQRVLCEVGLKLSYAFLMARVYLSSIETQDEGLFMSWMFSFASSM